VQNEPLAAALHVRSKIHLRDRRSQGGNICRQGPGGLRPAREIRQEYQSLSKAVDGGSQFGICCFTTKVISFFAKNFGFVKVEKTTSKLFRRMLQVKHTAASYR
jgi:hypothetical protein